MVWGEKSGGGSPWQGRGLAVARILIGVFFVFEGAGKVAWLTDPGPLSTQFARWLEHAGPISRWYLQEVAIPWAPTFARLVVLGELACGLSLVFGVWTRLAAAIAFFMVMNFHVASGAIFQYRFLTNGYGLPVLASLLALAIGGTRLPWSIRKS